ncbi:MAG TPA: response regulator transcription factor [Candidatus Binatia bacterium]
MRPRIIIVDDHRLFRACLKSMLQKEDLDVAGEAGDGRAAIRLITKVRPDVVTTDISMPGWNGIEFVKQIHHDFPNLKLLVVSMHKETRFIMESFASGASGYLLKDSSSKEIGNALKIILTGQKYIGPDVAEIVIERAVAQWLSESSSGTPKMSAREREVLQLVAEGKSTKEIAATLYVSIKTVETHRRQIMARLNLLNIAQMTKFAVREGITSIQ